MRQSAGKAIFSVIDETLLHLLSYPRRDQLVRIANERPGAGALDAGLSVREFKDFQRSGIFQYVSGKGSISGNLTGSAQPLRIAFKMVAPNYFALLGPTTENRVPRRGAVWTRLFSRARVGDHKSPRPETRRTTPAALFSVIESAATR